MTLISTASYKTLAKGCLASFLALLLGNFYHPANAQTFPLSKKDLSVRQQNRLKCGYEAKEIFFKVPPELQSSEMEQARVEGVSRCGYYPDILLTALVPKNSGITISAYPTFFFYIPDANLKTAEFILYDNAKQKSYKKTILLKDTDTIINVNLSGFSSLPPLEMGKQYSWIFRFTSGSIRNSHSISGWIQRVELNPDIKRKLETVSLREHPSVYAANGIWYEALASLAELRCSHSNNRTLTSDWESLLEQVGLSQIATKSLAQCDRQQAMRAD